MWRCFIAVFKYNRLNKSWLPFRFSMHINMNEANRLCRNLKTAIQTKIYCSRYEINHHYAYGIRFFLLKFLSQVKIFYEKFILHFIVRLKYIYFCMYLRNHQLQKDETKPKWNKTRSLRSTMTRHHLKYNSAKKCL